MPVVPSTDLQELAATNISASSTVTVNLFANNLTPILPGAATTQFTTPTFPGYGSVTTTLDGPYNDVTGNFKMISPGVEFKGDGINGDGQTCFGYWVNIHKAGSGDRWFAEKFATPVAFNTDLDVLILVPQIVMNKMGGTSPVIQ